MAGYVACLQRFYYPDKGETSVILLKKKTIVVETVLNYALLSRGL